MKTGNIISHFLNQSQLNPERIAILNDETNLCFAEFRRSVNQFAHHFEAMGVQRGNRIIILHPVCTELFSAIIALLGKGCTVVFVEEWSRIDDIAKCCEKVQCDHIITNFKGRFIKFFHPALRKLKTLNLRVSKNQTLHEFQPTEVTDDTPAIISFSSGSSGPSKAVVRTHGILNAQFEALKKHIAFDQKVTMCTNFPVVILLNLGIGMSTYLSKNIRMSDLKKSRINELYEELKSTSITHLAFSPFILRSLARFIRLHNHSKLQFQQIISGGSPVFPIHAEAFIQSFDCENILILFGSSEAEPIAYCSAQNILENKNHPGIYAGQIDDATNCMVGTVNDSKFTVSEKGSVGEVLVSGRHVVRQYLNSEDAFLNNKIMLDSTLWHRTGDYGYLYKDNELFLSGKQKYQYGESNLFDIEKRLSEIDGIDIATLIEETVYVQMYGNGKKESVLNAIHLIFPEIEKVEFIEIPLDRRHNGKIKYHLLGKN